MLRGDQTLAHPQPPAVANGTVTRPAKGASGGHDVDPGSRQRAADASHQREFKPACLAVGRISQKRR